MKLDETIGLILVDLTGFDTRENVEDVVAKAVAQLPAGRTLIAMWCVDSNWVPQVPVEAWVTRSVLGNPSERTESTLEFFGNGTIRTYRTKNSVPDSSWNWLCFRRPGEKSYRRRLSASPDVVDDSTLGTLLPVFTRDAANNVWHVSQKDCKKTIRERFQVLFTWSDESTIEVRPERTIRFRRPQVLFSEGLIGTASKIGYTWEIPRLS